MMKCICAIIAMLIAVAPAHAINILKDSKLWSAWGYNADDTPKEEEGYDYFIIAGDLGMKDRGTYDNEYGLVAMVAQQINEHGVYLCPAQIQCANKYGNFKSWTRYFWPKGGGESNCVWLCEKGYTGDKCLPTSGTDQQYCDMTPMTTASDGKFAGFSMAYSGESIANKIMGFKQWYGAKDLERDVIIGAIEFLNHGVIAAPVRVSCGAVGYLWHYSYVDKLEINGKKRLLCAPGYQPNASGKDCELVNANACDVTKLPMCTNFDISGYDAAQHSIRKDGACFKFFCTNSGMGFTSMTDKTCVQCANGIKGGANPTTGTCTTCETGQYWDSENGVCKQASAYSKIELQYGKGKTAKPDVKVTEQCWTKVVPSEYDDCVRGITSTNN